MTDSFICADAQPPVDSRLIPEWDIPEGLIIVGGPVFATDAELAKEFEMKPAAWRELVVLLEREGFPKVDELFGGRYRRAVDAWLDRRAGLTAQHVPSAPDGPENF